jgi:hypothetical protein
VSIGTSATIRLAVPCESEISAKFEPRWVVILSGRQLGPEAVKEFIVKKRYLGTDIAASELFV